MPILQGFLVVPYWAMVRFGEWDDILADKGPRHETVVHARGVALRAGDGADRDATVSTRPSASWPS